VRSCHKTRLFIAATHVRSGELRIFDQHELSADVVLASACLPLLFQAVEIEGEAYWDGGYAGNPSLMPLITQSPADDLLLVQINPIERTERPYSASDILDRINEITFNAALAGEMRAIGFVSRLIEEGRLDAGIYKNLRLHMVADDAGLAPLNASSKLNTERGFLEALHGLGRAAAERWLAARE
jgi:NTE family protein